MIYLRLLGSVDLRDDLGVPLRSVVAQPKRLAVLAYLALGNGRARRRDLILATLWPELDTARARAALRQALHHLRRELGDGALRIRGEELAVDPAVLRCDVCELVEHARAGHDAATLAAYGGPLLDGVHVSDASTEWDSWLEAERSRLRDLALGAARRLIAVAHASGDIAGAVTLARRACQLAPDDDGLVRSLVTALSSSGDDSGALRAYEAYARRLMRDFELGVSPELAALVARIRRDSRPAAASASNKDGGRPNATGQAEMPLVVAAPLSPAPASARALQARPWRAVAVAFAGLVAGLGVFAGWRASRPFEPTVLAVGLIRNHTGAPELADAVAELFATDLARAAGSRVISTPRMYELMAQLDTSGGERIRLGRAARAAGAQEFLEGALYRDTGGLRLELERVDLRTGRAVNARTLTGADPFALAERATESVLGTMNMERASGNLRDVVAQSPMALRFYQEGMRALGQNDRAGAKRFFAAAVAEDSTFAMATFELAMFEPQVGPLHLRALRLTAGTSDRERLMIQSTLAHLLDDPASRMFAETLSVRYPSEPDGPLQLGRALIAEGRFGDAIAPLRRVVVMDSTGLWASDQCLASDAYGAMVSAYIAMDSSAAAERMAREFLRTRPSRPAARRALLDVLEYQQRYDEARSVLTGIEDASGATLGEYDVRAEMLMREGRLGEAEAYLLRIIDATTGDYRANARWEYAILLRTQGRYREALAVADGLRARDAAPPAPAAQKYWSAGMRAMILYDMGRNAEAIALRDSAKMVPFGFTASRQARSAVSELAHIAAARAALRDTAALRGLAVEVERLGSQTGYAMHRRMYHYVRGLQMGLLGHHDEAIAELRQSIFSPVSGFVLESYALSRELIAAGRPRDAVVVLDAALRGPIGAGGLAVTRPNLEVMLGRAHEMAHDTAAAIASYGRVVSAWEHADPAVAAMRTDVSRRIRALTR